MGTEHKSLLLHSEVCWLTREKFLRRFYELKEKNQNLFLTTSRKSTFVVMIKFGG